MPAPKDKLVVPLGLGLQTDVDEKLLPVGKVISLQNGAWQKSGELVKRGGSFSLGTQYAASVPASMPAAWQMATHKGSLVSLSKAGPRPLGVYSPAVTKWVAPAGSNAADNINGVASKLRGALLPQRKPVYRANSAGETNRSVSAPDFATDGTYLAVAWSEVNASTAKVAVQFLELATGKVLFTYSQSTTFGQTMCRVVFVNSQFQLVYINGTNLRMRLWTVANIAAGASGWQASGEFTLATDVGPAQTAMDAIAKGTDLFVIYNSPTNPRAAKRDSGGVITLSTITTSVGGALNAGNVAWMRDPSASGALTAIIGSTAQGVSVQWNITGGTPTASYVMDAASGFPNQLTGATTSNAGTGEFVVVWETTAPALRWGRRTVAGGVSAAATWILTAGIASTMWLHGVELYMLVRYDSVTQGTLFAIRVPTNLGDATDTTRTPSARFASGQSVSLGGPTTSTVVQLSTDVFMTVANVKVRLVSSPAGNQFDTGVDTVTLTYNPSTVNSPREFADNLYSCGGVLGAFDGVTYAEEGFHLFPEITGVTQQVAGSLALLGNYRGIAVYRYTDNFGRVRRSAPSEFFSFSMTAGNQGALVSVRTLKLHGRPCRTNDGGRPGSVVIEYYRTTNNEGDLYQLAAVVDNDESVDTVTITDTAGDGTLGQDLYTGDAQESQALEFQPPPAPLAVASYKDRVAVIDAEDPTNTWVSLPLPVNEGPRFNTVSSFRIDDARGDLVGHAAVDDRLVSFKKEAIYAIQGDGPDFQGNGTFGLAQLIAAGVGCSEPRSIVQTPDGVMFRSSAARKGIMMVNRGLAIDDQIGAPVQEYLTSLVTIVDAVHLPDRLLTKFFTNQGTTLVYDHARKTWSTDLNQTCFAAAAWKHPNLPLSGHAIAQSTSILFVAGEDTSDAVFDDTSSPVEMYVESPWLSMANLKGYLRFDRVQLVGGKRIITDSSDPGYIVQVTLYKDFDNDTPLYTASRTMTVSDDINAVEVRYSAKVSALKVGVRIKMATVPNFAGPKLSALVIRYLSKEGLRKIASGNRLT